MNVLEYLKTAQLPLYGRKISLEQEQEMMSLLPKSPHLIVFLELLRTFPLCGAGFCLDERFDESGLGAELMWLSPSQIASEAFEAYPGKLVLNLGYLPVGSCLNGSGDYYYLKIKGTSEQDPPLVRVPHEAVNQQSIYKENEIEIVSARLSDFFKNAKLILPET